LPPGKSQGAINALIFRNFALIHPWGAGMVSGQLNFGRGLVTH
jgi:hypothetical protein